MALTIESITATPVGVPRTKPMISAAARGPGLSVSDFGIVQVRTSDGTQGVGEISMNLGRSGAIQCDDVNGILGPTLLGLDALDVRRAVARMERALEGSAPAKAAIEMALFDVVGKAYGLPVYQLLGGRVRDCAPVRWGLGFGDPDAGVEELRQWVERGFRTVKIKIGRPGTELDAEMLRAVREAFGTHVTLVVDANGAYASPGEAVHELDRMAEFDPELIEQPLSRRQLQGMAQVRRCVRAPILADESVRDASDAYEVIRAGAADALSIYVCDAGGLLGATKIASVAEAAGLPCALGSQCELGIGTAAMAHLAVTIPNLGFASDITGHLRYPQDIICERLAYADGAVCPPDAPGLGVSIDCEAFERFRLDK